jgi:hypothetical protein
VKRLAYALHDPPPGAYEHAPDVRGAPRSGGAGARTPGPPPSAGSAGSPDDQVERIVRRVLQELGGGR